MAAAWDVLASLVGGPAPPASPAPLPHEVESFQSLVGMGFAPRAALDGLRACAGDVDMAMIRIVSGIEAAEQCRALSHPTALSEQPQPCAFV